MTGEDSNPDPGPDPQPDPKADWRLAALADSVDQAEAALPPAAERPRGTEDRPPDRPPDRPWGVGRGELVAYKAGERIDLEETTGLPKGCPVRPLGIDKNTVFVLSNMNQVLALGEKQRSRNTVASVFAPDVDLAFKWWPRTKKKTRQVEGEEIVEWEVTGIKAEDFWDDMVAACARAGIWDPTNTERSTGGWTLASGELVFHVGDRLIGRTQEYPLGVMGRHVYTGARAIQRPWTEPVSIEAGLQLLDHFESWNWQRGEPSDPIDAVLLLGWHAASRLGAALKWRPMAFVIGGAGTGKSTLHGILKLLHAEEGIIYATDTTEAALANQIGHSSRPVVIDELENSADNNRAKGVMNLARLAASGANRARSDANQGVTVTVARNAMLFDAINPPEMTAATRSRFAMLRLGALPADAETPTTDPVYWDELGRKIMRRLLDHWDRFDHVLGAFHERLTADGRLRRFADQFATLLAAAHLVLSDHAPEKAELDRWAARLAPDELVDVADGGDDAQNCVDHLAACFPAEYVRGKAQSTAEACRLIMVDHTTEAAIAAEERLALAGMKMYLERETYADGKPKWMLMVANSHPGLAHIFAGTQWHTSPGVQPGNWVESLRRLDGMDNVNRKVAGRQMRGVAIPVRQHIVDPWQTDDDG